MSIETFSLVRERLTLAHMNIRTEQHGDERHRAVDLTFDFSGANNLLSKLHPDLRHSFYKPEDTKDMLSGDHTPVLRYPLMGAVSWELEIPRTRLQLHDDDTQQDVIMGGGKTNKFKLTLMDGGTVKWHFRVQFSKTSDAEIAGLSRFLNQSIPVSLECKALEDGEGDDLFDQVEKQTKEPMSEARQQAEDLFSKHGTGTAIEDDPDFREVKDSPAPAGTVTVESVHAGLPDDVVDAEFIPPADGATQEEAVASVVASIDKVTKPRGKRTTGKATGAASLE